MESFASLRVSRGDRDKTNKDSTIARRRDRRNAATGAAPTYVASTRTLFGVAQESKSKTQAVAEIAFLSAILNADILEKTFQVEL